MDLINVFRVYRVSMLVFSYNCIRILFKISYLLFSALVRLSYMFIKMKMMNIIKNEFMSSS